MAPQDQTGLWLLPRKDSGNGARCELPGTMRGAPARSGGSGALRPTASSERS